MKNLCFDLTSQYYNKSLFSNLEEGTALSHSSDLFLKELETYSTMTKTLGIPNKYDLILCNPPWIPASRTLEINPLDNAIYDPEEKFLKSALNFASKFLFDLIIL